jgi:hypothetical protein
MSGDGLIGVLFSDNNIRTWRFGPGSFKPFFEYFIKHTLVSRTISAVELFFGVWFGYKMNKLMNEKKWFIYSK